MKRKIISILLVLCIFEFSTVSSFAYYTNTEEVVIGTFQHTAQTEMWHYSGGYWILAGGTAYEQKITDAQLACAMNIKGYLQTNYVTLEVDLPEDVKNAINSGKNISFTPKTAVKDLNTIFDASSIYGEISNGKLLLHVKQKLPLFGLKTFDDFVTGLTCTLPLVDYNYGWNLYSIYKKGNLLGSARGGYYSDETKVKVIDTLIHPYMIQDNTGKLRISYLIQLSDGKFFYPSSHYVGWGTFKNGGAVGCRFSYTFKVEYKSYDRIWIDDPVIIPDPVEETGTSIKWMIHREK